MRTKEEYELLFVALKHVQDNTTPVAFAEICLNAMCCLADNETSNIISAIANGTQGVDKTKTTIG